MDKKTITYIIVGVAILAALVLLLKYSKPKDKADEKPEEQKPEAPRPKADKAAEGGGEGPSGLGEEPKPKEEPAEEPRRPAVLKVEKEEPNEEEDDDEDQVMISPGEESDNVLMIQMRLSALGYEVEETGVYDDQTAAVLKKELGLVGAISIFDVPEFEEV